MYVYTYVTIAYIARRNEGELASKVNDPADIIKA